MDRSIKQFGSQNSGNIVRDGAERLHEPDNQGVCCELYALEISEATLIESHQHACPNMS